MKKIYLLALAAFSSFTVLNAQSSLVLTSADGSPIANGSYINATTTPGVDTDTDVNFKNTSTLYNTYRMKRYDVTLNTQSSSDYASAYFCTGINCYSPGQTLSNNVDLASNSTEIAKLYLTEASVKGPSLVRYLIYNTSNANDTITFYVSYNNMITSVNNSTNILTKISDVYPNPSTTKAQISFISNTSIGNTTLTIINSLGVNVYKKEIELTEGRNTISIDVDSFATGIYFVQLTAGNSKIVKKFTVNK